MRRYLVLIVLLVFACKAKQPESSMTLDADNPLTQICQRQHEVVIGADPVVICNEFNSAPPMIKLPKASMDDETITLYGVLADREDTKSRLVAFVSGGDEEYAVTDDAGKVYMSIVAPDLPVPDEIKPFRAAGEPNLAFLYTVYKVTGILKKIPSPSGKQVSAVRVQAMSPAVIMDGLAKSLYLLGSWEGWASARNPDAQPGAPLGFSKYVKVPIRIEFLIVTSTPAAQIGNDIIFKITAAVSNLTRPIMFSNGLCMPALNSLKKYSPLYGATTDVAEFARFPGMHGAPLDSLVIKYPTGAASGVDGMAGAGIPPADYVTSKISTNELVFIPHGPVTGHGIGLRRVKGGGQQCFNPVSIRADDPNDHYLAVLKNQFADQEDLNKCKEYLLANGALNVEEYLVSNGLTFDVPRFYPTAFVQANADCFTQVVKQQ